MMGGSIDGRERIRQRQWFSVEIPMAVVAEKDRSVESARRSLAGWNG
jgi:hypothetical protein